MTKKNQKILLIIFVITFICFLPSTNAEAAIKLNAKTLYLEKYDSYSLKVRGTRSKIKWVSDNKSIATVSPKGKVRAKKIGSTTITAQIKNKKYRCKVNVVKCPISVSESITNDYIKLKIKNTSMKTITINKEISATSSEYKQMFRTNGPISISPGKSKTIKYRAVPILDPDYFEDWDDPSYKYLDNVTVDLDELIRIDFKFKSSNGDYSYKMRYISYNDDSPSFFGYYQEFIHYCDGKRISPVINDPGISYSEFRKIRNGMTYSKVTDIIGGSGDLLSSFDIGDDYYETYKFEGEKNEYSGANIEFKNDKVISKFQYGL